MRHEIFWDDDDELDGLVVDLGGGMIVPLRELLDDNEEDEDEIS